MSKFLKTILCFVLAAALILQVTACDSSGDSNTPEADPTGTLAPSEKSGEPTSLPPADEPGSETETTEDTVVRWSPHDHDEYWGRAELVFDRETGYTLVEDEEYVDCCWIFTKDDDEVLFEFLVMDYATGLNELIGFMRGQNPDKLYFNEDTKLLIEVHSSEKTEVNARINDSCCLTIVGPDLETIEKVLDNIHILIRGEEYDPLAGSQDLTMLYGQGE